MKAGRKVGARRGAWSFAAGCLAILLTALLSATATAAVPPLFWQSPVDGEQGSSAGRLFGPSGIGVEATTPGHLFVADRNNARVAELTVWGEFERAWGWEVVASGPGNDAPVNERQELTVSASGGAYALRYVNAYGGGNIQQVTVTIPFDASASAVQAALEGVPSLEPGDVAVSGGPGDAGGTNPYLIEFTGNYADKGVLELAVVEPTTLSGGSGASVATTEEGGSFEVCVPSEGDVCQSGQRGGYGPGQFTLGNPGGGVAVDGDGDVYEFEIVAGGNGEEASLRGQKFDNEGNFLLMWGGEVNKTTGADRCTKADLEAGDVCGAGVPGTGPGEFEGGSGNRIAVGPGGTIFVGDRERIQEFDQDGNYLGEVPLPGRTVEAMAMDDDGNFYVSSVGEDEVGKFSPAGGAVPLLEFKANFEFVPGSVAVGEGGEVYVIENPFGPGADQRILGYQPNGVCFICFDDDFDATAATDPFGLATSTTCGILGEHLYASFFGGGESFVRAHGPAPDPEIPGCEPPKVPPRIEDQFASSVSTEGAVLGAMINPRFWSGPVLGPTRYYVQYATAACIEAGGWEAGCVDEQPSPPGKVLEAEAVNAPIATAPVSLAGLAPGTAYRYRFVAESPGGGPVFGKGGTLAEDGAEGEFTTFEPPPGPEPGCENDPLRGGPAALLPDCRAYEMVSPVEKEGGDIATINDAEVNAAALNQSSASGDALTYSAFRAFGDPQSAPVTSQYLARRGPSGWQSEAIAPPRGPAFLEVVRALNNQFKAFSPDLCGAWLLHESPTLAPSAVDGFVNLYRADLCEPGASGYQALTTAEPPNQVPRLFYPELQGVSTDGEHAIFRAEDKLTPDAPNLGLDSNGIGIDQLYEAFGGQLRFVCLLPNDLPAPNGCVAGTASTNAKRGYGREQAVDNAISDDGSRIFWSDSPKGPGKLYVRIEGSKTQLLSNVPTQYWTAAADGSVAVFTTGNLGAGEATLRAYDVDAKTNTLIAAGVYGVMGASGNANRIYFASGEMLDEGASVGAPNLYLYEGGEFSFIATLSAEDAQAVAQEPVGPLNVEPNSHAAQVTEDGLAATFMSTASLTGRENTDVSSGEADAEVFHYDAESGKLSCASCNPTGARPSGRAIGGATGEGTWAASQIPGAQTQLYPAPKVLSTDGKRLFFESFQPLVANDTNGKADVYQWEQPGKGSCTESHPTHSSVAGGCVTLISSGQSGSDSMIADASPSGDDIFFATASPLLPPSDVDDLIDVYDARVLGGFPPPMPPREPCEGEACQSPPAPPGDVTPASSTYEGPGNPKLRPRGRRCIRGAHRAGKRGQHTRRGKRAGSKQQARQAKRAKRCRRGKGRRAAR